MVPDSNTASSGRRVSRVRAAVTHLLISLLVAAIVAALVFGIWFPGPLRQFAGGISLFFLITGVDVVCGPLLTLVIFNPLKQRRLIKLDLAVIGLVQLAALAYGVHTLSYSRPVALVFEVDRFRAVTFADIDEDDAHSAPPWAQPWGLSGPRTIGIRSSATSNEKMASIDSALQGIEPSQRPSWWENFELSVPKVLKRAKDVALLRERYPDQAKLLNEALSDATKNPQPNETTSPDALRWLPLVGRHSYDWVVLLDPVTARIRGYVKLDGFF